MNAIHSPGSVQAYPQGASIVQVETSRFLPWMVLTVLIAGISLGLSLMTTVIYTQAYRELSRETRLQQLKLDDMAVALKSRGIDPTPSHEGNAP